MGLISKKALVIYTDIGIFGTFVALEQHPSEKDYYYLKYVPEGASFKQPIKYENPIHNSAIHWAVPTKHVKGVPERILFIYTKESGSIFKKVIEEDYTTEMNELRAENKSLEMKNTSLTQDLENARAGVSKAVSSARKITNRHNEDNRNPFDITNRFSNNNNFRNNFDD